MPVPFCVIMSFIMAREEEEKSKIDEAQEALYSRETDGAFVKRRHSLRGSIQQKMEQKSVESAWNKPAEKQMQIKKTEIPYTKIFIGAFIFFILAVGFTFYNFFSGGNAVSGGNIDINITGPVSIAGGDILPLDIVIKNNNSTKIQAVDMHIEYPQGSRKADDTSVDMKRYNETLGDMNPGQSMERTIKAIIFGQENTQQIIKVTLEYRIPGSSAIFDKEKDYTVLITSAPVNIKVVGPTEVNSNQQVNFTLTITSNSLNILKGLLLKADYPFGFNFVSSNPKSISNDGSVYDLGDLSPGAQRTITISGIITGQDGEERDIKFTVGSEDINDPKTIGTPFTFYTQAIMIKKPFVSFGMMINQDTGDVIAIDPGAKLRADMSWQNNLTENINNLSIVIKLTGLTLDKSSVNASGGYYNSFDNTVTYDKSNISAFGTVKPSDQGNLNFTFSSLNPATAPGISFNNSEIDMDIKVLGSRTGSSQQVLFSGTKALKISSSLKLLSRGYKTVGPWENSGPIPPKVDQLSTYTITWTATDSFNNVTGAKVTAILPPNVKWTGKTSPDTEKITYDNGSGQIVWDIGDMRSGTGSNYPAKEVSFQVSVTPSISQVGQNLNLLNEATIGGLDAFSGARIGETKPPVTTNITSDPSYVEGIGKVVN